MLANHLVALLAALGGLSAVTASPCRPRPRPSASVSVSAAPVVPSPSGVTNEDPVVTSPIPSILPSSVSVAPEASASVAPEVSAAPSQVSAAPSEAPSASVAPEAEASVAPEASASASIADLSAAPSEVPSASVSAEASVTPSASVLPSVSEAAASVTETSAEPAATAPASAPVYTDEETGQKTPLPPQLPELITANPTAADEDGSSPVARAILQWTNDFRAQFDAPPLTWDSSMAKDSTAWAKECKWEHAGSDNLNMAGNSDPKNWTGTSQLTTWAQEYSYYPFSSPQDEAASHFTQMVWKDHTQMGCSWNLDCGNDIENIGPGFEDLPYSILFSCKYSYGGNMGTGNGEYYKINVGNWVNA